MFKKEIIWREILYQAMENDIFKFQQQKLAKKFNFSLSTVFNALIVPKDINAIQTSGKGFVLKSLEKMLYIWATQRKLQKDIIYKTFVNLPIQKLEANIPADIIWGSFSAYKKIKQDAPSEYSQIYIYTNNLEEIKKRFPLKKGPTNLFILKPDKYLKIYGPQTCMAQTFVDIWNNNEWYTNEFIKKIKEQYNLI